MLETLTIGASLFYNALASLQDLRSGEISDKINYAFTITIIILALVAFIDTGDFNVIVNTLLIGVAYFLVSYVIYYLGQWGGGDVKLMLGLGCTIGLLNSLNYFWFTPSMPYYLLFFINLGIIVMPYALIYMLFLALKSKSKLDLKKTLFNRKALVFVLISLIIPLLFYLNTGFHSFLFFTIILPLFTLSTIFLKSTEETLLSKIITVSKLKEYDALAVDVKVKGKVIASKRDIEGLSKKQLALIKKLAKDGKIAKKIRIRWGVRFAPALLLALILTVYVGDLMWLLIGLFLS